MSFVIGGMNKYTVIETVVKLAVAKGLANLTLKELATELGVKSPSFYKHIPSGLNEL